MIDFFSSTEAFADGGATAVVLKIAVGLAILGMVLGVALPVIFGRLEARRESALAAEGQEAEGQQARSDAVSRRQWKLVIAAILVSIVGSIGVVGASSVGSLQQRSEEIQYYAEKGRDVYGVILGFGDLAALGIIDSRSHRSAVIEEHVDGFLNSAPIELRRVGSGERLIVQAKKVDENSFSLYEIAEDGTATELQSQSAAKKPSGVG